MDNKNTQNFQQASFWRLHDAANRAIDATHEPKPQQASAKQTEETSDTQRSRLLKIAAKDAV